MKHHTYITFEGKILAKSSWRRNDQAESSGSLHTCDSDTRAECSVDILRELQRKAKMRTMGLIFVQATAHLRL